MDDPDLPFVEAIKAGDERAFDELMARHKVAVHRFVFRCVGNEEDAEELAQETFVRAYLNLHSFRPTARFSTWLFQIALNLARDAMRSRRYRQRQGTDSMTTGEGEREFPHDKAGPDEALQQRAKEVEQMVAAGQPTSPTRIDLELATNPFLRPNSPDIRRRLGMEGEPDWKVFGEIRDRKNRA